MKTVTFSESEIRTLRELVCMENICKNGCVKDYKTVKCNSLKDNGEFQCELQKDLSSIGCKIGLYE